MRPAWVPCTSQAAIGQTPRCSPGELCRYAAHGPHSICHPAARPSAVLTLAGQNPHEEQRLLQLLLAAAVALALCVAACSARGTTIWHYRPAVLTWLLLLLLRRWRDLDHFHVRRLRGLQALHRLRRRMPHQRRVQRVVVQHRRKLLHGPVDALFSGEACAKTDARGPPCNSTASTTGSASREHEADAAVQVMTCTRGGVQAPPLG
ncbi:hypothetical protein COO60DRAFT_80832 [Scenedesmus sp. NREL 46B-D3]|nr:hypothetical protein COO60DRAFT_80832 [Scenedesmus sp. NREL 46B-D3]